MTRVDSARVKKYAKVAYTRFDMCVSTLFSPFAGVLYTVSALEDPARSRSRSSRANSRASRQSDSSSRTESRSSSRASQPDSRPSSRASCCSSEHEMRPACRARSGTTSEPVYCSYVWGEKNCLEAEVIKEKALEPIFNSGWLSILDWTISHLNSSCTVCVDFCLSDTGHLN